MSNLFSTIGSCILYWTFPHTIGENEPCIYRIYLNHVHGIDMVLTLRLQAGVCYLEACDYSDI